MKVKLSSLFLVLKLLKRSSQIFLTIQCKKDKKFSVYFKQLLQTATFKRGTTLKQLFDGDDNFFYWLVGQGAIVLKVGKMFSSVVRPIFGGAEDLIFPFHLLQIGYNSFFNILNHCTNIFVCISKIWRSLIKWPLQ